MPSLQLGSLNINGLNDPNKAWTLKRMLLYYNISIVGIQDTRISVDSTRIQEMKNIFGCPSAWSNHCALFIFDKNVEIISTQIEFDHRVLLLSLSLFGFAFSVAVVYAPPQKIAKDKFYISLSNFKWPENIIFFGDFNCYLNPAIDQYPATTIQKPGAPLFLDFCMSACVADVFEASKSSMANMSRPTLFSASRSKTISGTRIDAILASNFIRSYCTSSSHIQCTFTDHRLVLSTWSFDNRKSTSIPFINHASASNHIFAARILKEIYPLVARPRLEDAKPIQEIWSETKFKIVDNLHSAIKARAAKFKAAHKRALNTLNHLERFSPLVPSLSWTEKWYKAFDTFTRLQLALERRSTTMATYTHLSESETTSPYFLKRLAKKHKFLAISALQDSDGSLHKSPGKLAEISTSFYSQLYADSHVDPFYIEEFLNSVPQPNTGSEELWAPLIAPIKEDEITQVIKKFPRKKASGEDGIPYEVYRANMPLFTMIFIELFNDCLANLLDLPGSSISKIILLYKKEDATNLKNWRPISLTNTDYKILTKVLNSRLSKIAIDLISPHQYGFIPGRQIWDNIHHVNNLLQSRARNTKGYALFLDMEKAYDRISWPYLYAALKKFNCPDIFISWLQLLYSNLKSYIVINTNTTEKFPVLQGLRQGDPMSPILFNFAIDFLLRSISHKILGIRLSSGIYISHMAFADDTVVCIGSLQDKSNLITLLKKYQLASNSKVNVDKTVVVKINNPGFQYSLPAIPKTKIFRHLGVLMTSEGISTKACENFLTHNISSQVALWSHMRISLSGRCIAANVFLLSQMWYLSHIVPFSESFFSKLNRILQKWFWPRNIRAPVTITSLTKHRKSGGLGLLDPVQQSLKILSKWLIPVVNPSSMAESPLPCWVAQARHNWHRSLNIHWNTVGGIQNFLMAEHKHGPHSLEDFWRQAIHSFKNSPITVSFILDPKDKRSKIYKLHVQAHEVKTNKITILGNFSPRTPMVKQLTPTLPTFDPLWNLIWNACHTKLVPGFIRTTTWRTISLSWKSADRMHCESPYYYCPVCKNVPNKTAHKYFYCSSISDLWQSVYKWLNPDSHYTFDPLEELFFNQSKLPPSFCILVFHCVISVIHAHFIRASFKNTVTPIKTLMNILAVTIQAHIDRVWNSKNSQIGNQASIRSWPVSMPHALRMSPPLKSPQISGL